MKVRKILAVLLSFWLLFDSVLSLNVKAASDDVAPISCSYYVTKIGYGYADSSPVKWFQFRQQSDVNTYTGTFASTSDVESLYFLFWFRVGEFSHTNSYRLNVNITNYYNIRPGVIKSACLYRSRSESSDLFNDYILVPDAHIELISAAGSSSSDLIFTGVNAEFVPKYDDYQCYIIQLDFSPAISTTKNSGLEVELSIDDITNKQLLEGLDQVQGAIEEGNQQAHEDASKVEDAIEQGNQQAHEDSEEEKNLLKRIVDGILGLPKKIIDGFIDGLKNLFIPDSEAVNQIIKDIQDTFSDAFGFLSYPFDLLGKVLDLFLQAGGDAVITVPEWRFMDHVVIPEYTYNLSENPIVKQLFPYIRSLTSCILAWNFLGLCRKKYDEVIKGGDSS